ncbi:MAG: hypothetical protein QXG03_08925 [Halalkalicoccus sp.]
MDDSPTELEQADVVSLIETSRLVFGAVLVDGTPRLVDCLDDERFEDGADECALATAVASVSADLVPMVAEHRDDPPSESTDEELPRLTSFEDAADTVRDGDAYYLLVNRDAGNWTRVRDATAGADDADSEERRLALARALVDESTERIGSLPETVSGEDIGIIDWGS